MFVFILLILITGVSLVMALRKKKSYFLAVPFISIFLYFLIEIIMVPEPFFDTVKFIFSLS
ncbi:hypothetical protein [Mesobacillus maritimus]|uniref:Exosortase n=1 Tax=Mesobacillus maritimus TaxID=1643336 RepID=A0ABS7K537_9BACI|nr:hypothetical protein [Mesobacillus maritimus]MBY0097383.1 hypothetical protein [Mesobacillus maritimus]